jgi:putative ABC transport system permease protein
VSVSAASSELNALLAGIVRENPTAYDPKIRAVVTPLNEMIFGKVATALWVLFGAVGLVLLIACANVANLLLARATGRQQEIALRAALGAGRARLIRQLLAESLMLAVAGGVLGLFLAWFGTAALAAAGPKEIPRIAAVKVDLNVLLFGFAASLIAGMLFGLAPALRASRVDLTDALKELSKSTAGRGKHALRNALVIGEFALAFVLVMGAGLIARSFVKLMNVDPGFDPKNVVTLNTYVYAKRYQSGQAETNYRRDALARLHATAGIESAAFVSTLPLTSFDRTSFHIQDRPLANPNSAPSVDRYSVSPEYFNVMRIPVKRGRTFTDQDHAGAPLVAVISESCASTLFAGRDAIGQHIQLGGLNSDKWLTVVGVVGDVRQYGLDRAATMAAYIPMDQNLNFGYMLVARTAGDPQKMLSAVRSAMLEVDKTQPVFDVMPMDSYLRASVSQRSFLLTLLGVFAALAMGLAAIGIYGVISYAVSLRTREIGIRMAIGAHWPEILRMVLKQGVTLAGAGVAIGFAASLGLTQFLASLLFDVRPTDLATASAVVVALGAVAMLACYIPARRASKIDPIVALRYE